MALRWKALMFRQQKVLTVLQSMVPKARRAPR